MKMIIEVGNITQEAAQLLAAKYECKLGRTYNGFSFEFVGVPSSALSSIGTLFLFELNFEPGAKYLGSKTFSD